MRGPNTCKGCPITIYFDTINGKTRAFEDEFGITPHLCKGFKSISHNPGDYFTYENLLKAFIANQQTMNEKLDKILGSIGNTDKKEGK